MSTGKATEVTTPAVTALPASIGWPVTLAEVRVTGTGPVRFHPSLRTAAQLSGPASQQLPTRPSAGLAQA